MPIVGTFNGSNIVQTPSSPAPKTIDFTAHDVVAVNTSPFSGQQQIQDWQASWLEASVSLPPLTHAQAQAWIAFLLQVRGSANIFQLGDPLAAVPQGSAAGTPLVYGGGQTGYTLATAGWNWSATANNVLLPGDWIQIGYRLYRNLDIVSPVFNGTATLNIWPQLRETPAPNTPIITKNTQGLWRLAANDRKWSMTEARIYGIQFQIREAL